MTAHPAWRVSVWSGPAIPAFLAPAWDALLAADAEAIGGRSSWVLPTVRAAGADGWGVVVHAVDDRHGTDGTDGTVAAAGIFVDVERDGVRTATLAGADGGYRGLLPARDVSAAETLAHAVADELDRRGAAADFGPLPSGAVTVSALVDRGARPLSSAAIPQVRRDGTDDVRDYLSPGMRKTLRKARNRMKTDNVEPRIDVITDPDRIAALLPAMEKVYRERDHRAGRVSALDLPAGWALWRGRILELLSTGHGEIAVLRLNEEFSAYAVGLLSGGWYGLGEGRFETAHARYTPGRYLEALVLQRVLADPELHGIDWMTGLAPDTLLAWNDASPTVRLVRSCRLAHVPRPRPAVGVAVDTVISAR